MGEPQNAHGLTGLGIPVPLWGAQCGHDAQVWDPKMVLVWLGSLVRMQGPGTPGWHQRSWCGHGSGQGWGHKCDHGDLMAMELTGLGTLVWT